jgi:23S rRNA pseudouridine2605 synthase
MIRLNKAIALSGLCSRRTAETYILQGRVSINGQITRDVGISISSSDIIEVDGKQLAQQEQTQLIAFYKPMQVIVSEHDPQGRKTIYDILPKMSVRWIPVGRLDYLSEGLLLLTTSPKLATVLMRPQTGIEREYRVRVNGRLPSDFCNKKPQKIEIDGITYHVQSITLEKSLATNHWLRIVLTEGKNREIRNICRNAGLRVNRLIRTRFGDIKLGDLQTGQHKIIETSSLLQLE